MIYPKKIKKKAIILLTFVQLLFLACNKEKDEIRIPSLSFVESTLPTEELPFEGGSVYVTVEWAYTKWNIKAGEVIDGNAFIKEFAPAYAGSTDQGTTQTKVKITFNSNNGSSINRQKVVLKSLTSDSTVSFALTQSGKAVVPTNIVITPTTTYQKISGFGGANKIWGSTFLSAAEVKKAFGTEESDLGLNIMRVRVGNSTNEWPPMVNSLKEAMKYNAKIFASPWSPPANFKTNNNIVRGELLPEYYDDYAKYLDSFVTYMSSQGVNIYAISLQNEPDWEPNYEGCDYTPAQILNFIKNNASAITGNVKIAASESLNLNHAYTDQLLNDPDAVNKFDIVAGHIYGSGLAPYPLAEQKGKEVWMTEYLLNQGTNWDQDADKIWDESMEMLGTVHTAMQCNWNAYVWWYIKRYYSFLGDGEQGSPDGIILKRGYAFSQFSKFVRPGYTRIKAQADATTELKISAYTGDNKVVIVIINPTNYLMPSVNLSIPQAISAASAHTTSITQDRLKETLTANGNKVTVNMAPKSVTTVVIDL